MPVEKSSLSYHVPAQRKERHFLNTLSVFFSLAVIIVGISCIIGWAFDIPPLKRPIPGLVAMNPLTALCFILSGTSFLFSSGPEKLKHLRKVGYILAGFIILLSVTKLAGTTFGINWKIDHVLFAGKIKADTSHQLISSMAVNTALGFVLSGIAILLLNYRTKRKWAPAQFFAIAVFAFGFFSLLGYLFKAPEFYDLLRALPMALHTSLCFMLLSLAVLFVYPERGITNEFISPLTGAFIGRILIGFIFVIPIILGAIRLYISSQSEISSALGTTLLVLSLIVIYSYLLIFSVILLNKKDLAQKAAEKKLRESREIFQSLVTSIRDYAIYRLDQNGYILTWNKGAEILKGYTEDEIIGKHFSIFYTEADIARGEPAFTLEKAKEAGRFEKEAVRVRKDGSIFWADIVVTTLYNENGELNGYAKVTRDITESKKAKDLLTQFNRELSRQVTDQTAEIQQTTLQLRQLAAHLQTAREEERKYIAREIHDELGQMLTGLKMDIVWLRKKLDVNDEIIQLRFERSLDLLNDTRKIISQISRNLHPALLEDLGLSTALESYCREFQARSGLKINFTIELDELNETDIAQDITIGLYRIFQEALTNIAKHAQAEKIGAYLKKEDGQLKMGIIDDGIGFNMAEVPAKKTLGLVSIRERILMLNGKYEIQSTPGNGTKILLKIPLS